MGEDYNDDHEKADNGNDHHDDHEEADQQNDENCLVLAWVKRSGLPRRQNHSIDLRLKSTLLSIIVQTNINTILIIVNIIILIINLIILIIMITLVAP